MSMLMPSAGIATLLAATALLAMLRLARRHRQLGRTRLVMLLENGAVAEDYGPMMTPASRGRFFLGWRPFI